MVDILRDLNPNQRKAVQAGDGPFMIIAGPGTGKTKTLAARIVNLLSNKKATPDQILALTFTKKAAQEMASRITLLIQGELPEITTFHALCYDLLGGDRLFVTDAERLQILKSLPRPKTLKELSARELSLMVSRAKNSVAIEDTDLAKFVRAYNKALTTQNLRDFDDLLLELHELLSRDEAKRQTVQSRYRYILVDEFQDTNSLQYEIVKLLLGNENIFAIGDPKQSIYGFRGASSTVFDQFRQDFPDVTEITLTTNYRSVPQIVRLSNALFPDAPDLLAHSQNAGLVRAVQVLNEYGEAHWVLSEIQRGIGGSDLLKTIGNDAASRTYTLGDFAILYRSRSAAQALQKLLAESGLPYQVVGDGSPYDQPQIQAILALMRTALHREPIRLEGYTSAERRQLELEMSKVRDALPSALVERIVDILGFEPNPELQQFAGVIVRFKDVASALQHFDRIAEHGFYDPSADAITLMTIHASKGLEFPHVFLIGAEEGILPSSRGDAAEEKRLFYVAATRARERLEITHARNRGGQKAEISRFVRDLQPDILKRHTDPDIENQIRRIAKRTAKNSQTSLF